MAINEFYDESRVVSIDTIYPNPKNPNTMSDKTFESLVDDIDKNGLVGSILVRKHPTKTGWEIIDGEHRWKACKQLNYTEMSIIELDYNDINAVIQMIRWNREKGYFDNSKLTSAITELIDKTNRALVRDKLHMDSNEFDDLLSRQSDEVSNNIGALINKRDEENYNVLFDNKSKESDDIIFNSNRVEDESDVLLGVQRDKPSFTSESSSDSDSDSVSHYSEKSSPSKYVKVSFEFTPEENDIISDFMDYYSKKNEKSLGRSGEAIIEALVFYLENN